MDFERKEEEKKQNELGNRKEQAEKWIDLMGWLQMYVGESNIDRIVDLFVRQEEENFALFTYINELNSEVYTNSSKLFMSSLLLNGCSIVSRYLFL